MQSLVKKRQDAFLACPYLGILADPSTLLSAAIHGTKEVAVPVTFGILTTIAAFMPLAFTEGHPGQIFKPIPAVVIPVLMFSLVESK